MSDVKWIKITTDIFDPDGKLFAIETLPDGHLIELFWFKTLVLTGKLNMCGFLINSAKYPYTDEMLSKAFNMEIGTVQRAIEVLQQMNMIEVIDNAYMVSNWLSYQHADSLEEFREKNAERQRKFREKQKEKLIEEKENKDNNVTVTLQDNVTSSYSYSLSNNLSSNSLDINNTDNINTLNINNTNELDINSNTTKKKRKKNNDNDNERIVDNESSKVVYIPNDTILNQAFSDFVDMRKKIKRPVTRRAVDMLIKKLNELSGGDNDVAVQIIEQSIMNGWLSFYALPEVKKKQTNRNIADILADL